MSKAATDTLEKVSGEFEGEVLADLQAGRGQALSLIESTRREAAETVAKILQSGTKQAESLKRQIIGAAELKVRNAQLEAMEEAVNGAFSDAVRGIHKVPRVRYEKCIAHLLKEGIDVIGPKATVSCNSRDRDAVASAAGKLSKGPVALTLDSNGLETAGGVVLTTSDGSVRFDNTFEARLERMRPTLRKDVADLLGRKH
jgi:V/A-type H+-transporting ATPase subunit E